LQQAPPGRQLLAQSVSLAQDALSCSRVVPEVGLGGLRVKRGQCDGLAVEVKDAPTSRARA
jgi:hypothetical protein